MTNPDCQITWRCQSADHVYRFHRDRAKSRFSQLVLDRAGLVISKRRSGEITRRFLWEYIGKRRKHQVGKLDGFDPIPHIEQKSAAGLQYSQRFSVSGDLIWKEHNPELADDNIENGVVEREVQCVGLSPGDTRGAGLSRGVIQPR